MCKLNGINFGYADSEKELSETPELFDSAFVDPKNHLDKLINGIPFLVLGRKGSGKTAYGAKIRRLAMNSVDEMSNIVVRSSSLSDLNYSTFEAFADQGVKGGRRFLSIWKYLLLLEMVKLIQDRYPNHENNDLTTFTESLKKHGVLPNEDLVYTARHLDKTNISLALSSILNINKDVEKDYVLGDVDAITEIGMKLLHDTYFSDTNFFIIIDGLDDALRGDQFSSDIITGLIRAADNINLKIRHSVLNFKIIILLRTDIFELCRDPDLTKIRRDLTVNLSWTKDDLKNIVIKRVQNKYPRYRSFQDFWKDFAPQKYKGAKSSSYLLDLTLIRPRDILQFFIECQELYGNQDKINYSDLSSVISSYSKNYFISEMKDELTGILSDEIVTSIPSLLSELGQRTFFEQDLQQVLTGNNINISARKLLEILFSSGYIGQVRMRDNGRQFVSFIHVNPFDKYSPKDKCIVHRGLVKALNIT